MAAPFRKPLTLFEEINRILTEDDLFRSEELTEMQEKLNNFRKHSSSTQFSQDRMLQQYKNFVGNLLGRFSEDAPDDIVDEKCFPDDQKVLIEQLEFFMLFVAKTNKGRNRESSSISYRTYTKFRVGMMFWCDWFYSRRDLPLIQKSTLFNKLTTAMQAAAEKWKMKSYGILNRTHVGLPELRQMIDHDIVATPCIELAECHHLAWCIGRVAAVRPGSIGPSWGGTNKSKSKEEGLYLKWKDVVITRGEEQGMFDVAITFRNLKTNYERIYEAANISGRQQVPLKVMVKAPRRVDNILLSVPLRLLIIALRRKIIVGITTVDELLNGQYQYITIAPEFLDKPIILASSPRGLSVKPDSPVMSRDLTSYLQPRGKKLGYESSIAFYSIRRRSATDLGRVFGPDKAPQLMGHEAGSRLLEAYYMDSTAEAAVSAAYKGLLSKEVQKQRETLTKVQVNTRPDSRNLLGIVGAEVTYSDAVKAFMELVLDNKLNRSVDLKNDPQKCVLCADDETVPNEQKNHLYRRHDTLREHMSGLYHTPKAKFGRWIEVDRQMKDITTEEYACPYCPESAPTFKTRKVLFKHIGDSTQDNPTTDHDNAKRDDGWYDFDWAETPGETVNKKRRAKRQAEDRNLFQHRTGFVCSGKRALEQAIPDPDNEFIVLGGPAPKSAKLAKYVEVFSGHRTHSEAHRVLRFVGSPDNCYPGLGYGFCRGGWHN